jgi:hypothetical protein
LKLPLDSIIDSALNKYNVPTWVRPYIYKYVKENPVSTVKFAISLVDVKRKKGEVTKTHVKLPNGKEFKMESILKLLNLFYYGEESIASLEKHWATESKDRNAEFETHFQEMSDIDYKYTRAIKNLTEGLGHSVGQQNESIKKLFDYISSIENWNDRIVATGLILRYSYARTFGTVFYKVFYPVAPEFMRSFGKAFRTVDDAERWDSEEARRRIRNNSIDKEHTLELVREILPRIMLPIEKNMSLAKELELENEVKLLCDISIAYPFQVLSELGMELDVEKEVKQVKIRLSKLASD